MDGCDRALMICCSLPSVLANLSCRRRLLGNLSIVSHLTWTEVGSLSKSQYKKEGRKRGSLLSPLSYHAEFAQLTLSSYIRADPGKKSRIPGNSSLKFFSMHVVDHMTFWRNFLNSNPYFWWSMPNTDSTVVRQRYCILCEIMEVCENLVNRSSHIQHNCSKCCNRDPDKTINWFLKFWIWLVKYTLLMDLRLQK